MAIEIQTIKDYGFGKDHDPRSVEIYDYIEKLDFLNGDAFCFTSGGDGDNGEMLMDLLDAYFKSKDPTLELPPISEEDQDLGCARCHKCLEGKTLVVNGEDTGMPITMTRMILCVDCGNKRCPKATNHELECTNSNEPGQTGSIYE
jgi:hypothetical protein